MSYSRDIIRKTEEVMKKVLFYGVSIIGFLFFTFLIVQNYQEYRYLKNVQKVKTKYNEEMKNCKVIGTTTNYVYLTRIKEDGSEGADAKWSLTNQKTKKTYSFQTDEHGIGGLAGMEAGEYLLKEIKAPKNDSKDKKTYKLIVNNTHKTFHLTTKSVKSLNKVIIQLKNKNNIPIPNVKYDLYNSNGTRILTATTDEHGQLGIKNITAGYYYMKREGIKRPKKHAFYLQREETKILSFIEEEEIGGE